MKCPSCLTPMAPGDRVCPVCQSSKNGAERYASWNPKSRVKADPEVVCAMLCWLPGALIGQATGSLPIMVVSLAFGFGCLGISVIRWFHIAVRVGLCVILLGMCFAVVLAMARDTLS